MAEPLKDLYNPVFFEQITPVMKEALPRMDEREFIYHVFDRDWPDLELKQRVRKIAVALKTVLPAPFPDAAQDIRRIAEVFLKNGIREQGFQMIFLPEYVGLFGEKHVGDSLDTLEQVTRLVSGEFAIRIFLLTYPEETLKRMKQWSEHADPNVRRLASEGCRPRLPWAISVPWLKRHPERILPILENLKGDPSEYVRRSVANNLNDIAKDHPQLVLDMVERWKDGNPFIDQVIRHGCRTLLKKGDIRSLSLQGINQKSKFRIVDLEMSDKKVKRGGKLTYSLTIENREKSVTPFRLDYWIDYPTPTGRTSIKGFRLKDVDLKPGEKITIVWSKVFKDFTIRKQCTGTHQLHIHVNGLRAISRDFLVVD